MKKLMNTGIALGLALLVTAGIGCGPNGDNNSTDANNEVNEGRTDSTRLPDFGEGTTADTTNMNDTSNQMRDTTNAVPQ